MDRLSNLFLLIALLCHPYVESHGNYYKKYENFDKDDSFDRDGHFDKDEHVDKDEHFGPDPDEKYTAQYFGPERETENDYTDYKSSHFDERIKSYNKNKYEKTFEDRNGFPHFGYNFEHKHEHNPANFFDHHGSNADSHGPNRFDNNGPNNFDHPGYTYNVPKCNHHGPFKYYHHGPSIFGGYGQMHQGDQGKPTTQFGQQNPPNNFGQQNPPNNFGQPPRPPNQFGQDFNPFGQNFNQNSQPTTTTQRPTTNFWTLLFSSTPTSAPASTPSARGTTPVSLAVLTCVRSCPVTSEYNPVCGSNNQTYNNLARLECAMNCGVPVTLQRSSSCAVPPTQPPVNPNSDTRPTTNPSQTTMAPFETRPTRYTTIDVTPRPTQTSNPLNQNTPRPGQTNRPLDPATISPDVLSSIFNTGPTQTATEDYDGDIDIRFES